ncbi:MAG: bifunctional demethylmenaquinone methyltransferase/2-methoxy-6-polyprenyl-1,4-benzoquinol methylase UbiE [Dysgonamonadaceae bacterium]|jgi:demethylmenaquinone methyltransferase/2-methoxy-6-polyprenyl-1,4-benzoquinol methylase|nr:bifunctional demethylmenaquinone methyltransferase/2-methoxy-6-polyprenyl-1,4-benzoquinol methylase UbiE [Dysgonamonadaceae bacterium]
MTNPAEKILPDSADLSPKSVQVERMFDAISGRYDLLNHSLSMGIDKSWRRRGISALKPLNPRKILDIATGTGDLAIEAVRRLNPEHVLGIDLSEQMMAIAREKTERAGLSGRISFERQDCAALTLADNTFDAAIVAFGVRNFENLDLGLSEILRVIRPEGRLMILELTTPEHFPMKQAYSLYSKAIPTIGRLISGGKSSAYRYLPESIRAFPQGEAMKKIMENVGYQDVIFKRMTFGICTMYIGTKK